MEFSSQIGSPGLGTSAARLSVEPLATEGEATRGPDDTVDEREIESATFGVGREPYLDIDIDGDPDVEPPAFGLPDFGRW